MHYDTILTEVRHILADHMSTGTVYVDDDDDLTLEVGVNLGSLAALEILTAIETRFSIRFPDEMIDPALASSTRGLALIVSQLLARS